jgi:hypothetical protein
MISSACADPREWGVHHHPAGDPIRILRSEGIAHHIADIMGDKIGPLDLQLVENTRDTAGLGFLVIAIFGMRREPHSPQIRDDDRVIVHQTRRQGCPHVACVAEAVQHDDGRTSTSDPDVDGRAPGLNLIGVETGRERLNSCHVSSRPLGSAIVWRLQVDSAIAHAGSRAGCG